MALVAAIQQIHDYYLTVTYRKIEQKTKWSTFFLLASFLARLARPGDVARSQSANGG